MLTQPPQKDLTLTSKQDKDQALSLSHSPDHCFISGFGNELNSFSQGLTCLEDAHCDCTGSFLHCPRGLSKPNHKGSERWQALTKNYTGVKITFKRIFPVLL